MVREVKRPVLRECWLHIWFCLMLPDAHAVWACLAGVLSRRLRLMRRRIAAHLCSRSVIWALRKAMPMLEAVKFENKPASDVLRARFFVGIKSDINISSPPWSNAEWKGSHPRSIDAAHFFIPPKLLFRRDQHNKTLVLYAFPAVSSRRWAGAKPKFVCEAYRAIAPPSARFDAWANSLLVLRSLITNVLFSPSVDHGPRDTSLNSTKRQSVTSVSLNPR